MEINIIIPQQLLNQNYHQINYKPLSGKKVIGLCGYAQSGKDSLGSVLVSKAGYKRISFGDIVKEDLNTYMKELVHEDLKQKNILYLNEEIPFEKMDFLNPETNELKEILRPYMIWFGESLKRNNGMHQWTNRAFSKIQPEDTKLVITDVRRPNELEIFRNSRLFAMKTKLTKYKYNINSDQYDKYNTDFDSLLIEICQLNNKDMDDLTIETLITAREEWLIDHSVMVDSRIPAINDNRERHLLEHLYAITEKFPEFIL